MVRLFNSRQRTALYLSTGGICATCGVALEPGWHADHWFPFSRGGSTDVVNGQPLCPSCNAMKGARVYPGPWPAALKDRPWQQEARMSIASHDRPDFLCVATPGAGKTNLALHVVHDALSSGLVERVVVVTPTTHLRKQWARAAHRVGIELDPSWENDDGPEARDFHGVGVSYEAVASNPDNHRHQ